ncbi:hypothetical protein CBER1_05761 [Cercospora berteroae]|uniref:enoyl-[acyl-carrier-protein] reductase n=1 Tax=Cercospora berteroae TaxID=357750 RepID=A0A2S6BT07_9PEZI|nr:hypothetical protein CBER1_05761 [Cercospora berteroae]
MAPFALTFSSPSADAASAIRVQKYDDEKISSGELAAGDVLIRFLAIPVNPQDLMAIAGKYPVQPVYSTSDGSRIAGNDGVARVESIGPGTKSSLAVGDVVLPKRHGLGTWRNVAILPADALLKIPRDVEPVAGALLKMGFAPGYLLVEDMVTLQPGDWIVVNAALGVIPQTAIQFARLRGCHAIAVVRSRGHEELEAARELLLANGAAVVVSEEELATHGQDADPKLAAAVKGQLVKLALDAVWGPSAEGLVRLLAPNASYVNYGSLGGADVDLRLGQEQIFWRQIKFRNFRFSQQLALRSNAQVEALLAWFVELLREQRVRVPRVDEQYLPAGDGDGVDAIAHKALHAAQNRAVGTRKTVLVIPEA